MKDPQHALTNKSTIFNLVDKFCETGSAQDLKS